MTGLFLIGSTDLTPWEDTTKHAVNREDIFVSWTDGNWVEHREIMRTRVAGTVVLGFKREADFTMFMGLLTSERNANGYYPITVWCSNTNTTETVDVFFDVNGDTTWDVTCPRKYHEITIAFSGR